MTDAAPPVKSEISVSRGFADWLGRAGVSLAFTSYQTGQLFLVGRLPDGRVSINQHNHSRAMGVHGDGQRLYLGTLAQLVRLENILRPGETANGHFDRLYMPRNMHQTGDIDFHELAVDRSGRVVFVSSKFSCLAVPSITHGFRPIWKPAFVSRLAAEDRCHLNGLAMRDGAPAAVTAVSRTDIVEGWRPHRADGGVVIDLADDAVLVDGLAMPHSPRFDESGALWLCESGRGRLLVKPVGADRAEELAFCPGFLRGLAFAGSHVVTTLSKPRDGSFSGLPLSEALAARGAEAWCGVVVVDRRSGDMVEWLRVEGDITELFDVAVLPGVTCPMSAALDGPEARSLLTYDADWGPLVPG